MMNAKTMKMNIEAEIERVRRFFTDRTARNALLVSVILLFLCYLLGGTFPKYMLLLQRSGLFIAVMRYAVFFGIAGIMLTMNRPQPPLAGEPVPVMA